MQAYKLYFKVFKKNAFISTIIFIAIFSSLTIMFSYFSTNNTNGFVLTKCKVAVIDNDESNLSKELISYVDENANLITIENKENSYKDALFFRRVDYIAIIPEGFENSFVNNNALTIETMQIPDSVNAMLVSNLINSYLNTAKLYFDGTKNIDYKQVKDDLSISTKVDLVTKSNDDSSSSASYFINYFAYPMLSVLILAVSMIMLSINEVNVKRRYQASPEKQSRFTLKMLFANTLLMLGIFLVFIVIGIVIYKDMVLNIKGIWWLLNAFSFSLFALCLGFFISNIASKNTVSAIQNCVSLGLCFLGGAFIPQKLLSQSVLKFGVFNPVYWFIKANNIIDNLNTFNSDTLSPVLQSIGILLAFACAFAAMTLVVMKYKRRSNA